MSDVRAIRLDDDGLGSQEVASGDRLVAESIKVDDALIIPSGTGFPTPTEAGEIFWRTDEKLLYRWSGTEWEQGVVPADLACVAARRTTSFTGSDTWEDVTLNATDVENNTSVVEHDNTFTDRITVKETGLYQIGWFTVINPTGAPSTIEGRVRINDATTIPNSYASVEEDHEDANLSNVCFAELTANDYVTLQLQTSAGTETVRADLTFFVTRMQGTKGDKGDKGDTGPPGFTPGKTVIVAKTGGDESTISAGLAAAAALSPSSSNPILVVVYAGIFAETTPLTIPSFVSLVGLAGSLQTIITPDAATDVIIQGSPYSRLQGFNLLGASGAGGVGYKHTSSLGFVFNTQATDCETGFLFTGSGVEITCVESAAVVSTAGMTAGFHTTGSAKSSIVSCRAVGKSGDLITDGFLWEDCEGEAGVLQAQHCTNGLHFDDGAHIHCGSAILGEYTNGVRVGDTGSGTSVNVAGLIAHEGGTWDVFCESATAEIGISGQFDASKVYLEDGCTFSMILTNSEADFLGGQVFGDFAVGRYTNPSRFGAGGGLPFFEGVKVFRNTNGEAGSWSDVTDDARTKSGSAFAAFPGTGAQNCIYFGSDVSYAAIEIACTAAIVPGGGSVVPEYWDGSAWTAFSIMATMTAAPYTSYGPYALANVGEEFVHFADLNGDWAKKTLDGENKYWARYRITSAITTSPTIEWMRCVPHSTIVAADGAHLFFGDAMPHKSMGWHRNLLDNIVGNLPAGKAINLSDNISLDARRNRFVNNAVDGRGGLVDIIEGVNTSRPISLVVTWYASASSGDAELETYHAMLPADSVLDGTADDTHQSKIITVPGTAEQLVVTEFNFPIYLLTPDDHVGFRLFRDATGGNLNDNLSGDVVLVGVDVHADFWR